MAAYECCNAISFTCNHKFAELAEKHEIFMKSHFSSFFRKDNKICGFLQTWTKIDLILALIH